jgi:hypothetical protein
LDIDSLLRGLWAGQAGRLVRARQIASRALLRRGLSPQITTVWMATAAPEIAEARLRSQIQYFRDRLGSNHFGTSSGGHAAPPVTAGDLLGV